MCLDEVHEPRTYAHTHGWSHTKPQVQGKSDCSHVPMAAPWHWSLEPGQEQGTGQQTWQQFDEEISSKLEHQFLNHSGQPGVVDFAAGLYIHPAHGTVRLKRGQPVEPGAPGGWVFKDTHHKYYWIPFAPEDSGTIDAAVAASYPRMVLYTRASPHGVGELQWVPYEIDVHGCTQRNVDSGYQRPIKRVAADELRRLQDAWEREQRPGQQDRPKKYAACMLYVCACFQCLSTMSIRMPARRCCVS